MTTEKKSKILSRIVYQNVLVVLQMKQSNLIMSQKVCH